MSKTNSLFYGYDAQVTGDFEGVPLCWVADFINGYPTKPEEISNEGIPIIRIEQLNDPEKRTEFVRPDSVPDEKLLRDDDLILSWSGSLGVWWWTDGNAVLNQHLYRVIPVEGVNKRFLYYALQWVIPFLEEQMHGSTMTHITQNALRTTRIPIPPLSIQQSIADYLDDKLNDIDNMINKKEELMSHLSEKGNSLITETITKGVREYISYKESGIKPLGEIPQHWDVILNRGLYEEIDVRSEEGSEELLSVSHKTGVNPRSQMDDVNMFEADSKEGYKLVRPGDLVINTMWAWMGAAGISDTKGIVSPSYNVYRPDEKLLPEFVDLLIRSPPYVAEMGRNSMGVWESRKRLYPSEFLSMKTPVPPIEEQEEIVSSVQDSLQSIEKTNSKLQSSIQLLKERRRSLIDTVITGQIDIPETQFIAQE